MIKPRGVISTAWAYQTYDTNKNFSNEHPNTAEICEAINLSDTKAVCELMFNVLESVAIKKYPAIENYKEKLLEAGAITAMMSGSGPSIFAVAKSADDAKKIAESFKDTSLQIFLTETTGREFSL